VKRRLLIDSTVLDFVAGLRKRDRDFLFLRFEQIRAFPDNHADYQENDDVGRPLGGCLRMAHAKAQRRKGSESPIISLRLCAFA
jgi:hypothetical protein